jgi:hypothetical protein
LKSRWNGGLSVGLQPDNPCGERISLAKTPTRTRDAAPGVFLFGVMNSTSLPWRSLRLGERYSGVGLKPDLQRSSHLSVAYSRSALWFSPASVLNTHLSLIV